MLSNTAVPKYYGQFREQVLAGKIPVNEYISMEMNRIDDLIASPYIYYDDQAVEGWIYFCETELVLTDGSDFWMLDSFKLWGEQIYGWWYFEDTQVFVQGENGEPGHYERKIVKKRLTKKQYLIVARGASKTQYLNCHQAYELVVNGSTTHQITTAPTIKQSNEVLSPFITAIARARGPIFKWMTRGSLQNTTGSRANRPKLAPTKDGIRNFVTNSLLEAKPMSIPKLQGLSTKGNTVDEWLSCPIREDPIGAIEQGAAKVPGWWIIATSSEGTVRNGVGDTIKMELLDILKGKYNAPHISIWYYRLDDVKEVGDPNMWIKANPNIAVLNQYEAYMQDVERAEHAPAAKNDILAKRFGIPSEGWTYFFRYEETKPFPRRSFWQMPCALGADLSQGDDFCAFTFLFPLGGGMYGVKCRSYITDLTYSRLQSATKLKYDEFISEGSLVIMPGTVLDVNMVYEDLDRHITNCQYDVRSFGYDPYNAETFVSNWVRDNGPFCVEKVVQGARTESVPLGELKKLAGERLLVFDESIMSWTMGNCVVQEDTNGNRKLLKMRREEKIDNVAALLDAYVSYKLNPEAFD